jgi:hypothetical protein
MEENVFVYEGWRWTNGKGVIFRGIPVDPLREEYKIINIVIKAFLPEWEIIGIWKNKNGNYLIQLRTAEKVAGAPGGEDFYYSYLVVTEDGKLASSSYYGLKRLLEESIRERFG